MSSSGQSFDAAPASVPAKRRASSPACGAQKAAKRFRSRPSTNNDQTMSRELTPVLLARVAFPALSPRPQHAPTQMQLVHDIRRIVETACASHRDDRLASDIRFAARAQIASTSTASCQPDTTFASADHAEAMRLAREKGCGILAMISCRIPASMRTFAHAMLLWNVFLDARSDSGTNPTPLDQRFGAAPDLHFLLPSTPLADLLPNVPMACFQLACKTWESFAPRSQDLVNLAIEKGVDATRCSTRLLRDGEHSILSALRWDTCMTLTTDQVEKLLDLQPADSHTQPTSATRMSTLFTACSRLAA